jgi:PBP1b-binding outer membrane lipoprotein LpoB
MHRTLCITIRPLLIGCLIAAGCNDTYHSGVDVRKIENVKIEKNKTTEQDLIASLGPPANTMIRGDGSKMLMWSGVDAQSHDATGLILVPFVGGLLAHDDVNAHTSSITATVVNGIVVDYTISDSNQKSQLN